MLLIRGFQVPLINTLGTQYRGFARMTGRAGKLQHFRYGVSKVRGRWYYRYHKPIGRANWKGYQERYLKPKDVEAKQRLVFAPKATSKQLKQSLSWQWRLPRMLAAATSPNQVLDAWVLFRYRHPKKMYHYMMTLKRLVKVGGCEPTDWRLKVLLHRMRSGYRRIIGVDVFAQYLSRLNQVEELEYFTRFLRPHINNMNPSQLQTVLKAFADCHLRDPKLIGKIVRRFRVHGSSGLSHENKIAIIQSLGATGIKQSVFVSELVLSLLKSNSVGASEYASLLRALVTCRIRDHTVIELAVDKGIESVISKNEDPKNAIEIAAQLSLMGLPDAKLYNTVLDHLNPYDISCRYLLKFLHSIPLDVSSVNSNHHAWLMAAIESIGLIRSPSDILRLAVVIDRIQPDVLLVKDVWGKLVSRYMCLPSCLQRFNVAALAQIFQKRGCMNKELWDRIANDLHYSIENFEPEDLISAANVIHTATDDVIRSKSSFANVLAEWSIRRREEFSSSEWVLVQKMTQECGANLNQMLDSNSM
jgi:hypothetical protein